MSPNTCSPIFPSLSDAIIQVSTESQQIALVSCLPHMFSAFVDDQQTQPSGSGLFENARNILITAGTFVRQGGMTKFQMACLFLNGGGYVIVIYYLFN